MPPLQMAAGSHLPALAALKQSGVNVIVLLALSDDGHLAYQADLGVQLYLASGVAALWRPRYPVPPSVGMPAKIKSSCAAGAEFAVKTCPGEEGIQHWA
jgi:hypothetical protein